MFKSACYKLLVCFGLLSVLLLTACGGGGGSTPTYAVSVTVSGLTGSGLVLQNIGGDDLSISADGTFSFATSLADGESYAVSVLTHPSAPTQLCTVSNGTGTISGADVTNVSVACVNTYTVSVTASGVSGSGLVLQNNGGDDLSISADGSFSFTTLLFSADSYDVTVLTQPTAPAQICTITNGNGMIAAADITDITINCVNAYTISGTVSGLTGSGLVLQNNGGDDLSLGADGGFSFTTQIAAGGAYSVTVFSQPVGQLCTVSNGSGTIAAASVSSVAVQCIWTKQFGVAGVNSYGYSVATDASGSVYVAGETYGGLDGNALTGTSDFFVTKYNRLGVKQYTRQLGVAGVNTRGASIATDSNGDVYVAGNTYNGLDGNTSTGTSDFFVTKYNSLGVKQYTRQLGVVGASTYGASVATDASGNVYVTGYTNGGLDGNTLTGIWDFFVTQYNSLGVKQYTRQLGVTGATTRGHSVATDASGNVYVTGSTNGDLDGNTLTGTQDFFVTKYNSGGVKQYTRQLGVAGVANYGYSVATDASGNVYVAGLTRGGLDGNPLMGTQDVFVTKYNSLGVKQYTRQLGVAGASTYGHSVATDASGNVYATGYTTGGLDGNTLTGTQDVFVIKYDSLGVKQ
jgi:hypothetical protein